MANWNDLFTSGGSGLILPQRTLAVSAMTVKTAKGTREFLNAAPAYTAIEQDFSRFGFITATMSPVADTTEQTIIDVTGEAGVLTQVISPTISTANSDMIIKVTVDGVDKEFTGKLVTSGTDVLTLGGFRTWEAATASEANYGQQNDGGYNTGQLSALLTPPQAIELGMGIPYETSIKVTVQGSDNLTAGSATHKAVACRFLTIPEGL